MDVPKPPERGDKTLEEYANELYRWTYQMYDLIRYIIETGGSNNNDNI